LGQLSLFKAYSTMTVITTVNPTTKFMIKTFFLKGSCFMLSAIRLPNPVPTKRSGNRKAVNFSDVNTINPIKE